MIWDLEDEEKLESLSFEDALLVMFPELAAQRDKLRNELCSEVKQLKRTRGESVSLKSNPGVYRLWNEDDSCLYVGQSTLCHPIIRIDQHRQKKWWGEVEKADFIPCRRALLDDFERYQILLLKPRFNVRRPALRRPKLWLEEACA